MGSSSLAVPSHDKHRAVLTVKWPPDIKNISLCFSLTTYVLVRFTLATHSFPDTYSLSNQTSPRLADRNASHFLCFQDLNSVG